MAIARPATQNDPAGLRVKYAASTKIIGKVRLAEEMLPTEAAGFWPIVVGTGLTFNGNRHEHPESLAATVGVEVLDLMWTVQRADGGWNWPHCDYAPDGDRRSLWRHHRRGVTVGIALVTTRRPHSLAPGLEKLRAYFQSKSSQVAAPSAPCSAWCSVRIDARRDRGPAQKTLAGVPLWPFNSMMAAGPRQVSSPIGRAGWLGTTGKPLNTKKKWTATASGPGHCHRAAKLGVPSPDDARLHAASNGSTPISASGKWFHAIPSQGRRQPHLQCRECLPSSWRCRPRGELPGWPFMPTKPAVRADVGDIKHPLGDN